MRKHTLARATLAAMISCAIATACFYTVPDVTPEEEGGLFDASFFEGGFDSPFDSPIVRFDSSLPDGATCVRCKQTIISSETGTITAFTIDTARNVAFMGVQRSGGIEAIEALSLPSTPAKTTPSTLTTSAATTVTAITNAASDNRVFFKAGTGLYYVSTSGGTPNAFAIGDAGSPFTLDDLAPQIDTTTQSIFVGSTGSPSEVRRIGYVSGVNEVLASTASIDRLSFAQGGAYWLLAKGGGVFSLERCDVSTKNVTENTASLIDALAFVGTTPVVATSSTISQLQAGGTATQTTIASPLPGTPAVLTAGNVNGSASGAIVAYYSDSPGSGVVRRATGNVVVAAPAIVTPTGTLQILFLGVRGNDLYAAGTAGTTAYVVQLSD